LVFFSEPVLYAAIRRCPSGERLRNDVTGVFRIFDPRDEVDEIKRRRDIPATTKTQLILARRGQGGFRTAVEQIESGCRVTGLQSRDAPSGLLQAGHIKPWSESNDEEKLDGNNGLLLSPHIHYLFDHHLLTFDRNGDLELSVRLSEEIRTAWNLREAAIRQPLSVEQEQYMAGHRAMLLH
jgi:predicted restriction endonuclease